MHKRKHSAKELIYHNSLVYVFNQDAEVDFMINGAHSAAGHIIIMLRAVAACIKRQW